ncbi:MAG: helix-turn-helix transcriptional regulator [Clostridia bacterium]|nr:helix-turn-helix transcriptional regulator [Clostridia bacterium]
MSITLKAARINAGLGIADAAKALNVSERTLYSWEAAKRFPDVPQIVLIEGLYNVSYNEINFLLNDYGLTEKGGE